MQQRLQDYTTTLESLLRELLERDDLKLDDPTRGRIEDALSRCYAETTRPHYRNTFEGCVDRIIDAHIHAKDRP